MNLFQKGNFKLHSGDESIFKIDCDALTDKDIECLAMMIAERVKSFRHVAGIPTGGTRIAKALRKYKQNDSEEVLIVDDVLITGTSMEKYKGKKIIGAVIFARGECSSWITPLFTLVKEEGGGVVPGTAAKAWLTLNERMKER